jgi:hypothetical protein
VRRRKRYLILVSAPLFSDRLGRRPLHARLYLDEINQIADIGQALAFRTREPNLESLFDRNHDSDMIETIPTVDIRCDGFRRDLETIFVEYIAQNISNLKQDFI